MKAAGPLAARRALMGDLARDWAYVTRYQALGLRSRLPLTEQEASAGPAVVLLPGVYERWHFMAPLIPWLEHRGFRVLVFPALGRNHRPVADSALLVQEELRRLQVHEALVVAHSKGGLIGKYLMTAFDDGRISAMMAINTPFAGNRYARFAPVSTLRAFSPRHATIIALQENLEANAHITSVFSRFDPQVLGGSRLEGARNVELDVVGHFRILGTVALRDELEGFLAAAGEVRTPGEDPDGTAPARVS